MEQSKMKNMVVLKNLPSNIVEEAFVVLKNNKKAKKLEKVEKIQNNNFTTSNKNKNDYVLKEAEMLISNYLNRIEEKKQNIDIFNRSKNKKYRRLKNYAYISSCIILIQTMMLIIR